MNTLPFPPFAFFFFYPAGVSLAVPLQDLDDHNCHHRRRRELLPQVHDVPHHNRCRVHEATFRCVHGGCEVLRHGRSVHDSHERMEMMEGNGFNGMVTGLH